MTAKSLNWREVRRVLGTSGLGRCSLAGLLWPFGWKRRARALLQKRRSVLEAKNQVVDYLFRAQRPLAPLGLSSPEKLHEALQDPEKRRLVVSVGISRAMMEEALLSRCGCEVGQPLDCALAELVAAGAIMKVSGLSRSNHEVYVAALGKTRPHFDLSPLNQLLQEGRDLGSELKARLQRESQIDLTRTHRL